MDSQSVCDVWLKLDDVLTAAQVKWQQRGVADIWQFTESAADGSKQRFRNVSQYNEGRQTMRKFHQSVCWPLLPVVL